MRALTGLAVAFASGDAWTGAAMWFGLVALENAAVRVHGGEPAVTNKAVSKPWPAEENVS